jgi:hypothetical protein
MRFLIVWSFWLPAFLLLLGAEPHAVAAPARFHVIEASLHQSEDGPPAEPGAVFVPGEVIFFSCRLDGYQASQEKKVLIHWQFSASDPAGIPIIEPASGKVEAELALEDKEWKPKVRQSILVPPLAESGVYKVRFSATDELGKATATAEAQFEVRGHAVAPSDTLVIRNFRFYRSEDDATQPLSIAAYRPGDTVWARFDITGYKFGQGNRREVAYTVTVTAPDGHVMLAPRDPSIDQGSSFYPMKYAPCVISINLQSNIRPAEYTILIAAQDRIGNQTAEVKQTFRVE